VYSSDPLGHYLLDVRSDVEEDQTHDPSTGNTHLEIQSVRVSPYKKKHYWQEWCTLVACVLENLRKREPPRRERVDAGDGER
jgi:hypothetical protein